MFGYFCESRLPPLGNSFLNFPEEGGSNDEEEEEEEVFPRSHSFAGYMPHKVGVQMCALLATSDCQGAACRSSNAAGKCDESPEYAKGSPCSRIFSKETTSAERQVDDNISNGCNQAAADAAAAAAATAWDREVSTLSLQNLPRNMNQLVLARIIASMGFANDIDFLYAPSEFGTLRCKGLAFVNFVSPSSAMNFARAWSQQQGGRPVRIVPASLQGYDANMAAWERATRQRIRNPLHRPIVVDGEGMMAPYVGKAQQDCKERSEFS
mmetsp:Transcript_105164/g.209061  ORF Transcript_105164/g.209061 Transcript_105164/m.209061 type:complete len:267 (+) Transcript_105164:87-887(+)